VPRQARLYQGDFGWYVGRRIVPSIALALAPTAAYGLEHVPREGGGVVAANHFSGIDHPLIGSFSPRPLKFLAKAELLEIPVLGFALRWMGVFGIRRGESDREAVRRARELVRAGDLVCVHIEGTRQRLGYPGPVHKGGLMIAMQEGVPVIPLGLDTFRWSPANRRKCAIVWGESIDLSEFPRNRGGYERAADVVRAEMVRLWRQAAEAAAAGLPLELPDGTKRYGPITGWSRDGAGPSSLAD
jgi:1-acyl-sn-glycerol-3-phosphate acyltransferase